jgi:hypothetical protein
VPVHKHINREELKKGDHQPADGPDDDVLIRDDHG